MKFKAGDIVTRDGTDRHVVVSMDETGTAMTVRCVREPDRGWIKLGEEEFNLSRRYDLVETGQPEATRETQRAEPGSAVNGTKVHTAKCGQDEV